MGIQKDEKCIVLVDIIAKACFTAPEVVDRPRSDNIAIGSSLA